MADRNVEIDARELIAALQRLSTRVDDMRPVFDDIGELLLDSTRQRFSTHTSPDGAAWKGNKQSTIDRKGRDHPLTGLTGLLMGGLFHEASQQGLELTDPMEYAAMQQFGGLKAGFPQLWGDIPARPFMGLSDSDQVAALAIISGYLEDSV